MKSRPVQPPAPLRVELKPRPVLLGVLLVVLGVWGLFLAGLRLLER